MCVAYKAELSETMPNKAKFCFKADYFACKNLTYLAMHWILLVHSKSYTYQFVIGII